MLAVVGLHSPALTPRPSQCAMHFLVQATTYVRAAEDVHHLQIADWPPRGTPNPPRKNSRGALPTSAGLLLHCRCAGVAAAPGVCLQEGEQPVRFWPRCLQLWCPPLSQKPGCYAVKPSVHPPFAACSDAREEPESVRPDCARGGCVAVSLTGWTAPTCHGRRKACAEHAQQAQHAPSAGTNTNVAHSTCRYLIRNGCPDAPSLLHGGGMQQCWQGRNFAAPADSQWLCVQF